MSIPGCLSWKNFLARAPFKLETQWMGKDRRTKWPKVIGRSLPIKIFLSFFPLCFCSYCYFILGVCYYWTNLALITCFRSLSSKFFVLFLYSRHTYLVHRSKICLYVSILSGLNLLSVRFRHIFPCQGRQITFCTAGARNQKKEPFPGFLNL